MTREIFTFGSNRQGHHGKGAALVARQQHGAIYGQAEGLQGNSYAIVTKELRRHMSKVSLIEVETGVKIFLQFAGDHPELVFNVTAIGCGLAGFTPQQIAPLFVEIPNNVHLPDEFTVVLDTQYQEKPS